MKNFSEPASTSEIKENKFNEGVKLESGDLVKVMITNIRPTKDEEERVNSLTEIGGDWTANATFLNGMLFIATVLECRKNGKWIRIVDYDDYENIKLPYGKYGYQLYHAINFNSMFGAKGDWPFKVSAKMQKGDTYTKVQYPIPCMPRDWDEWTPAERYDYWTSMASLMLKSGKDAPNILESNNGWVLDQNSIHRLNVGDITTAIILKQPGKSDPSKLYTYLKSMVKNNDPAKKVKYIAKNEYDLFTVDNSTIVANAIYEAINKENDPNEKDIFDQIVSDAKAANSTANIDTQENLLDDSIPF